MGGEIAGGPAVGGRGVGGLGVGRRLVAVAVVCGVAVSVGVGVSVAVGIGVIVGRGVRVSVGVGLGGPREIVIGPTPKVQASTDSKSVTAIAGAMPRLR